MIDVRQRWRTHLVPSGGDVVRALPIDIATLVAEACERAGRNLTAGEWDRYLPAREPHRTTCEQWPQTP